MPHKFGTDRRTVFDYKRKGLAALALGASTQFGYACKSLGVDTHSTTCAQAQGKIEKLFGAVQSRLLVELQLKNVTTFDKQLSDEEINLLLTIVSARVVDKGNCISYENRYYRFLDENANHIHLAVKQKVLVIRAFDGRYARAKTPKLYLPPFMHPWRRKNFEAKDAIFICA